METFQNHLYKTTNLTHGYQGKNSSKLNNFYRIWSKFYDMSIGLDPAYQRELNNMIESVVFQNDFTADLGCGTGLSSIHAALFSKNVIAIDPSLDMTNKLKEKIQKNKIENIEVRNGYFPDVIISDEIFDSIISSFMFAHLTNDMKFRILSDVHKRLKNCGRIGLFSAQGEIASSFETKDEIRRLLVNTGFEHIKIREVSDIYRITTANKN